MSSAHRFCFALALLALILGGMPVSLSAAEPVGQSAPAPRPEVGVSIEESGSNPQLGAYYEQFAAEVRRRWQIPTGNVPLRLRLQGYVTHLGEAQNVEVVETTGVPVVDKAAIRAFEQAASVRPLPSAFAGDRQFIRLTMVTSPSDVDTAKPVKAVNFDPFLADLNKRV